MSQPRFDFEWTILTAEGVVLIVGIVLAYTVRFGLGAFVAVCGIFVGQSVLLIRRDVMRGRQTR